MFSVYVLISIKTGKSYVGFTEKEVKERLKEHNLGKNKFTKTNLPYKLVYFESYYCKADAIRREMFLKSGIGNRVVKAIINELNK